MTSNGQSILHYYRRWKMSEIEISNNTHTLVVVLCHLYFIWYCLIQEKVELIYREKTHINELRGWNEFFGYAIYFILSFIAFLSTSLVLFLRYFLQLFVALNSSLVNKSFFWICNWIESKLEFSKWVIKILLLNP